MKTIKPTKHVELMFRAFSDNTRLRILNLLRRGEVCVCDLVDVLDVRQPTISRHLAYLRKAGLVTARKDGLWSYYTLTPAINGVHGKLLECLASCFEDVPGLKSDSKKLKSCASDCCG